MATSDPLHALEEQFRQLKRSFDLYFSGVESKPPSKAREQFQRQLQHAIVEPGQQGARRFRLQQMQASLQIHEAKWDKLLRQIEEGTLLRDKRKAARRSEPSEGKLSAPPQASPAPTGPTSPNYAEQAVHIHAQYQAALGQQGGQSQGPSVATIQKAMEQQAALLAERHGIRQVGFEVVVKDGKPILKAIAKPR